MAGLAYLAVIGFYFYVFYLVVRKAVHKARERGRPGWHYGLPAFLAMYLPVFWDHIPTLVVQQYQCMNNAGLTVYKTPEQWIEENPEIAKSISPREEVKTFFGDGYYYYKLNQRLNWEIHKRRLPMGLVYENTDKIIDSKNNEVLVVQTDYDTNINNPYIGNADFRDYKIWLWLPTCSRGNSESKWHFNAKNFSEYLNKYKNLKSSN